MSEGGTSHAMGIKPLLRVLSGERQAVPPVWMMRQAGRYLPEYRAVREKAGGFLDLCFNPELAAEVTLQPVRRFGFDAAILFSDILVVPLALGRKVEFLAGEGPKLEPLTDAEGVRRLAEAIDPMIVAPVYETVRRVRKALDAKTTLIGFCGAPWTVATYMVAGEGTPDQAPARMFAYREPETFALLIDRLVEASIEYLVGQLKAGAECVQLFDTWAGVLSQSEFERWSVAADETDRRGRARAGERRPHRRLPARRRREAVALRQGYRRRCRRPRLDARADLRARPHPDAQAGAG